MTTNLETTNHETTSHETTSHETTSHDSYPTRTPPARPRPGLRRRRGATVLAAGATAAAVWGIAVPLLGLDLDVRQGAQTVQVGPASVAASSLVAGLAGWAALAALERWTSKAHLVWRVIASTVLVLSLTGPLAAETAAAAAALMVLHGVVAIVLIAALPGSAARGRDHEVPPRPVR